jgi:predicted nuclease with RNAse H fold
MIAPTEIKPTLNASTVNAPLESAPTVIGIDVGGSRKGFHAVALSAGAYAGQLVTPEVGELAHWCRSVIGAQLIAIDAPSRWSSDGRARPCERELNAAGIRCFASPSREAALGHPSNYFGWMLRGEALYRELAASHPPLAALPPGGLPPIDQPPAGLAPRELAASAPACFETFPHAITWQLRGGQANAAHKRHQRSELLRQAGLDPAPLTSIDLIDAALCALAAHHLASGRPCRAYGEAATGLIVVPQGPLAGEPPQGGGTPRDPTTAQGSGWTA